MPFGSSSLAAVVATGIKNEQFAATAEVLARKFLIIGTYDPLLTIVDEVPELITSPEDAGAKHGFGFMIHRLAVAGFLGSQGVECWVCPQAEAGTPTQALGEIDFAGSLATESRSLYFYVAGIPVPVTVVNGDDDDAIAIKVAAAVTAKKELPVTATVDAVVLSQVNFVSKSAGPWGDGISLTFNWGFQETFPVGVVAAVTNMAGGAGLPDIDDALNGLGVADDANEKYFTDVVHGYGQDSSTLNKLSIYNGEGNTFTGCYKKTVHRPFRSLDGDVAIEAAGLTALVALGDGRKSDRTSGIIAAPGSPNHPSEIASIGLGIAARLNNNRAEESYVGQILSGVIPGAISDRWTTDYDNRDTAVKAGISPTKTSGGATLMQNLLTFYHPDSVPVANNGYRSMRNISITQNILAAHHANFDREKWQGFSIVADITKVSNVTSRQKARDIGSVLDDLVALAIEYEGHAWLFTALFTISRLQAENLVTIRPGGLGFDSIFPCYYSGEGGQLNNEVHFDVDISALT